MEQLKREIEAYWAGREEKFEALRLDEFGSDMRWRWLAELKRYLPDRKGLDILDIGTGTGFFSFLLAAEGHNLLGIDLTPEMIEGARHSAALLGLSPAFQVMDAEAPDLPPDSFDAIVTRNLTSFLPNLPQAYARWHALLREGGVLINFDGDYHHEKPAAPLPAHHAHMDLTQAQNAAYAHIESQMRDLQQRRPSWDVTLLRQAGFREIRVDRDCYGRVYRQIDRFFNPTPIFCVTAKK